MSLGASIVLVMLLVIAFYNPSKLPLELSGLKEYTILDSDESGRIRPEGAGGLYITNAPEEGEFSTRGTRRYIRELDVLVHELA